METISLVNQSKLEVIALIHDSGHVGFQIVMQITVAMCYAWGQTMEKRQIAENRLVEILN